MTRSSDPLRDLVAVMDRLRSPGGCPWDAEQTHTSLVTYLVEETYETVEAIETADFASLREELGDLLLQVVFHARIASERRGDGTDSGFDIDDVAGDITAKLVRRHPHVFSDAVRTSGADVEAAWFAQKRAEKGRQSVVDGVPLGLPSLLGAAKLAHRAAHGGVAEPLSGPNAESAADTAIAALGGDPEAVGALLLGIVAVADRNGWDAEACGRAAVRDYRERLAHAERSTAVLDLEPTVRPGRIEPAAPQGEPDG